MTAALDTPAVLLAELTGLGIELRARGDRLRFRPQSAMTPDLAERVRTHKPGLLTLLADTPTESRGAGESIGHTVPGAELVSVQRTAPEPPPVDAAAWPTADDAGTLPGAVAALARKRDGWTPAMWRARLLCLAGRCAGLHPARAGELRRAAIALTPELAEALEERAAIMEHDAGLSRGDAEAAAVDDTLRIIWPAVG